MPHIIKEGREYLLVTQREKFNRKSKGRIRKNFMVTYTDGKYLSASGKLIRYPYAHVTLGRFQIRCPESLIGKRVKIVVRPIKLPGEDLKWKKKKNKNQR